MTSSPASDRTYCYATGLELGQQALEALCRAGLPPRLALGYDASLSHRSGYVSLRSLAERFGFELIETRDINDPELFERVQKVADAHANILVRAIPQILAGTNSRRPQGQGDFWPKRRPEDGLISWDSTAQELYNWVRALTHPYPGAFTFLHGRRLTLWSADMV